MGVTCGLLLMGDLRKLTEVVILSFPICEVLNLSCFKTLGEKNKNVKTQVPKKLLTLKTKMKTKGEAKRNKFASKNKPTCKP